MEINYVCHMANERHMRERAEQNSFWKTREGKLRYFNAEDARFSTKNGPTLIIPCSLASGKHWPVKESDDDSLRHNRDEWVGERRGEGVWVVMWTVCRSVQNRRLITRLHCSFCMREKWWEGEPSSMMMRAFLAMSEWAGMFEYLTHPSFYHVLSRIRQTDRLMWNEFEDLSRWDNGRLRMSRVMNGSGRTRIA